MLSALHHAPNILLQCVGLLRTGHAGTLLNSQSKILRSSVSALRAALGEGVMVCLATGKARPAAIAALQPVGLAGRATFLLRTMTHGLACFELRASDCLGVAFLIWG